MTNYEIVRFVIDSHGEQLYGDMPYTVHLFMVASHFQDEKRQTIALLHDILEDTKVTKETLYSFFGEEITNAVIELTRKKDETYFSYIRRVAKNPLAKEVKIADLETNLFTTTRIYPSDYSKLKIRYKKALKILEENNG